MAPNCCTLKEAMAPNRCTLSIHTQTILKNASVQKSFGILKCISFNFRIDISHVLSTN
jgi:hypothetical protein